MSEAASTAAGIARVRAEEALLPPAERLFVDPYANLFVLADPSPDVTERMMSVPYLRESVRLRTRFIDDTTRAALGVGIRQIVILGAGFDCRALRMEEISAAGATVWEVDFNEQLERKRRLLLDARHEVPAHHRWMACDFAATDFDSRLVADLAASGFRTDAGALFLWEGVIGYLDDAAVQRSLRFVAETGGRGTWLTFNYQRFRIAVEKMAKLVSEAGFATIEDTGCDELHRGLLGGEPPDLAEYFRLAVARTDDRKSK